MKKTAILSLSETRKIFRPLYEISEYENLTLLNVQNCSRAINKISRFLKNTEVIISDKDKYAPLLKNKLKIKKGVYYKTALPVIEKVCRQVACKHDIKFPFGEIYIMASPSVACDIIMYISGISRVFTVISEDFPLTNVYDEIYFKYGTIIRQLPAFNNNITADSIIIRCDDEDVPLWAKIPVIDFSDKTSCDNLSVKMSNICVSDERIITATELWGGKSGLGFYELFGEVPKENTDININLPADEIFLLDIDNF